VTEQHCFTDLTPGDYVAEASPPSGYGLTTPDQLRLRVQTGTTLTVAFGAATGVAAAEPPPADSGEVASEAPAQTTQPPSAIEQLLQNSGLIVLGLAGIVLAGGIGLTFWLRRH
jgi:hypothetical protein